MTSVPRNTSATLRDILASYTDKKRAFDRQNLYVYFVMRPLSWIPTWICLRLGISANGATWLSLLIGIAGCAAFAFGGYAGFLAGALLYNLYFLFDHIDGNIARFFRTTNHYGKFIDGVFGAVLVMLLFLAVGVGLYRSGTGLLREAQALLAFVAASAIMFRFYLALRLDHALLQVAGEAGNAAQAAQGAPAEDKVKGRIAPLRNALLRLEQSTLEGSLLIFAVLGRVDLWILAYGPLVCANCLLEALRSLYLAERKLNLYRPF